MPREPRGSRQGRPLGPGLPLPRRVESLTLLLPLRDQERWARSWLEAAIRACAALAAQRQIDAYEVLVVDDASRDATATRVMACAAEHPGVRLLRHSRPRGLGGCLKTGFADARGELVLYTDASLPLDPTPLAAACRLLRHHDADLVSAYRRHRRRAGWGQAVWTLAYDWAIRQVFGCPVRDLDFPFTLCRREVFAELCLRSESSFIEAELHVRAERQGYRRLQFSIDPVRRPTHHARPWSSEAARLLREAAPARRALGGSKAGHRRRDRWRAAPSAGTR